MTYSNKIIFLDIHSKFSFNSRYSCRWRIDHQLYAGFLLYPDASGINKEESKNRRKKSFVILVTGKEKKRILSIELFTTVMHLVITKMFLESKLVLAE